MNDADRDLVRRDPLPGLAVLLDDGAFTSLAHRLFESFPARDGVVEYLRYKPATNCISLLRAPDGARLYAKAVRDTDRSKLERFRRKRARGAAIELADELALAAALFPWDAGLPALSRTVSEKRARDLASRVLGRGVESVTVKTLRYKPERRWVGMLIADGERSVLRIYTREEFDAPRGPVAVPRDCGVIVPEVCGVDGDRCAIAVSWIEGRPLPDAPAVPDAERTAAAIGQALARFHASARASGPLALRSPEAMQRHAGGVADLIGWLLPEQRARAAALSRRMVSSDRGHPVVLHGDFYASQVLVTPNDEIAFIDLDEVVRGDRWIDLANFIAHLERDAMLANGSVHIDSMRDALVDAYAAGAGLRVPPDLRRSVAAALWALAGEPFRYRLPDWPRWTRRIVDRVEELLETEGRAHARGAPDESLIERALDVGAAALAFARLPEIGRARVVDARLVRRKEARRALIEYALEDGTRLLGKIRIKGTDRAAFSLQQALWTGGFHSSAPDRITVAEPLGVVSEWNMWLQQKLAGPTASAAIDTGAPGIGRRAAAALAKLHTTPIAPARQHTAQDELAILTRALNGAAGELPQLAAQMHTLLERSGTLLSSLRERPTALIHRDFHPDQLILGDDFTALIDLDLAAEGDPAVDVGNFIAHLIELALRTRGDMHAFDAIASEFRDTYTELNPHLGTDAIDIYVIASIARLVAISRRIPSRKQFTEQIVEVSLSLAEGATS